MSTPDHPVPESTAAPTFDVLASCWTTAGAAHPLTDHEQSPEDIARRVAIAAEAGFTGFGLLHADLVVVRDTIGYPQFRRLLDHHRIKYLELEMLVDWWLDGSRREASDRMRRDLLEAAGVLGARHIKAGGDYTRFDWPTDIIVRELRTLCEQAADVGTRIALEPIPFSNIRTPQEALRIIEETNHPAAGMLIDVWHVARAGLPYPSVAEVPVEAITTIELDDAASEVVGTLIEDTIHQRRLCGAGSFDLTSFVRAVLQTGYSGPWGVEILSHEHRARPIAEAIPAAFNTAHAALEAGWGSFVLDRTARDAPEDSVSRC